MAALLDSGTVVWVWHGPFWHGFACLTVTYRRADGHERQYRLPSGRCFHLDPTGEWLAVYHQPICRPFVFDGAPDCAWPAADPPVSADPPTPAVVACYRLSETGPPVVWFIVPFDACVCTLHVRGGVVAVVGCAEGGPTVRVFWRGPCPGTDAEQLVVGPAQDLPRLAAPCCRDWLEPALAALVNEQVRGVRIGRVGPVAHMWEILAVALSTERGIVAVLGCRQGSFEAVVLGQGDRILATASCPSFHRPSGGFAALTFVDRAIVAAHVQGIDADWLQIVGPWTDPYKSWPGVARNLALGLGDGLDDGLAEGLGGHLVGSWPTRDHGGFGASTVADGHKFLWHIGVAPTGQARVMFCQRFPRRTESLSFEAARSSDLALVALDGHVDRCTSLTALLTLVLCNQRLATSAWPAQVVPPAEVMALVARLLKDVWIFDAVVYSD